MDFTSGSFKLSKPIKPYNYHDDDLNMKLYILWGKIVDFPRTQVLPS